MSKCCAYHSSRSPAGILFGYQRSTNPGSDQLAVPTRIFPVSVLPEDRLVTHQRTHAPQRTQMGSLFSFTSIEQTLFYLHNVDIALIIKKIGRASCRERV